MSLIDFLWIDCLNNPIADVIDLYLLIEQLIVYVVIDCLINCAAIYLQTNLVHVAVRLLKCLLNFNK